GLVECSAAQPLGLAATNTDPDGRIVTGGTAKGGMFPIQGNEQDWRCPAAPPGLPRSLKGATGGLSLGGKDDHLEGVLAVADEESFRYEPGPARRRQRTVNPTRKKGPCAIQRRSPEPSDPGPKVSIASHEGERTTRTENVRSSPLCTPAHPP